MKAGRVVFMGTPDFAVPSLQYLIRSGYELLVVTQPDKPVGRKRVLTAPPVKRVAADVGVIILQPVRIRHADALEHIQEFQPDVIVTAAFGQLLPQTLLDMPTCGALNVHASLLPRWRGAAPIHRAIMAGDTETGVTLMEMVMELDAGDMVSQGRVMIDPLDTLGVVHDKLAMIGASLLERDLDDYMHGRLTPTPQPEIGVTYAKRIVREDEWINFRETSTVVHNHIRGLSPWPVASTTMAGGTLKIWQAARWQTDAQKGKPGACRMTSEGNIVVDCGEGAIELLEVQPSGSKRMPAQDWFRGQRAPVIQLGGEHLR